MSMRSLFVFLTCRIKNFARLPNRSRVQRHGQVMHDSNTMYTWKCEYENDKIAHAGKQTNTPQKKLPIETMEI